MSPAEAIGAAAVAGLIVVAGVGWIVTTSEHPAAPQAIGYPAEGPASAVPVGDLAGAAVAHLPATLANPLGDSPAAVRAGRELYVRLNCADCHGFEGKGGMGPDLTDAYWRYGGTPVQIYKTLYEGRPQGMPAWGRALPSTSLWQLTAYVQSFGGGFAAKDYHAAIQGDLSAPQDRKAAKSGSSSLEGQ